MLPPRKLFDFAFSSAEAVLDAAAPRSDAESCMRVLTTQIGLVTVPVTIPANVAAVRCTYEFSSPWLKVFAMTCLPLPYVKKLIERAGIAPTSVGPRPLKRARGDSFW